MPILRETGASLDIGFEKCAAPEMFKGEQGLVKHIHDDTMTCLQRAERKIECEPVQVVSKPIVSPGHLNGEKYFLEDQTIELLEPDLEENGLPRPEIGNDTQTRRQRKKEIEKSTCLENESDQFRLRECVVENGEVPSFTGECTDNGNLVKSRDWEVMEAQMRSEESVALIRGTENGASDEASDQEEASIQLVPDQKRMVLLPEEVGEKGFLESRSPTFRIDSSRKDMQRTGFGGPDWRQKA
ncbi:uncharacterized protein TNCV_2333081 [Trichonephila clavipes]|nr:uncharacterized protein TNCV_2333081 [Trichonephila clavipes]